MDYNVSVSDNGTFILVKVNKPMTIELARRAGVDATELGERHNIKKYLFDLRDAPNIEMGVPNFIFANEEMDNFGFPKNARSALLTDPSDTSHDFMEIAQQNAGFDTRLFTNENQAVAWLKG